MKEWQVIGLRTGRGGTRVLNKTIRNMYTPILLYRYLPRGEFVTPNLLSDLLDYCEPEKDWDEWQQPVGESVQLLKFLSQPGDLICDLFVGSGTVAVATALVGEGLWFVGCDLDATIVPVVLMRVAQGAARRVIRERVRLRWEDTGAGLLMSDLAVGYARRRLANMTRTLCESVA